MPSKRDLLLIRLAIRWRWLSPAEGEDCLFLKRKFGEKLSIQEIIRRRGYLEDESIATLSRSVEDDSQEPVAAEQPRVRSAPTQAPPILRRIESQIKDARTVFMASPYAPRREPTPTWSSEEDDEQGATVIAAIPDAVRRAIDAPLQLPPAAGATPSDAGAPIPGFDAEAAEDEGTLSDAASEPTTIVTFGQSAMWDLQGRRSHLILREVVREADGTPAEGQEEGRAGSGAPGLRLEGPSLAGVVPVEPMIPAPGSGSEAQAFWGAGRAGPAPVRDRIGDYRIERLLHRSSKADEYLAFHDDPPGRRVVLEVLTAEPVEAAKYIHARGHELLGAARIDSPHVVRILDVGRAEGRYYVAREFVEGVTLEALLMEGRKIDLGRALGIARQLASALVAARLVGAVHREVCPGTVVVTPSGDVRLFGFGRLPDAEFRLDVAPYRAPEQVLGGLVDHRSDLYGLGATLFHLMTGVPVVAPTDEAELLAFALEADVADVRSLDRSIPAGVAEILRRLLARDPNDRYPSADAVVDALDQAIFDREVAAALPSEPSKPPAPLAVLSRALGLGGLIALVLVVGYSWSSRTGWFEASSSSAAYVAALIGGVAVVGALVLLVVLALIRRGDLPLPISSAWMVAVRDGLGVIGASLLLAGFAMAPPAVMNVVVSSLGFVGLVSWLYGMLLRLRIARSRPDRGVGRALAVLADPLLGKWSRFHVPMHAVLTSMSVFRWAFLAYFSAAR